MNKISFIIRISNQIWWKAYSYFSTIFIADFHLLSCELDNVTFKVLIYPFYTNIMLKQNKILILSRLLFKNLKYFLSLLE